MDYSQYKSKPFQVISKLQCRYTGIFQDIDQETQTICLSEVYNHGTEDRPSPRALPGSTVSLGWVRFHINSIDSLALVQNYAPPPSADPPVDPILASVSQSGPSATAAPAPRAAAPASGPTAASAPAPVSNGGSGLASLPPKPVASATSAIDRVQQSLSDLSVDSARRRKYQQQPKPPAVPDTEFDFSKGTEAFQKERQAHRAAAKAQAAGGGDDEGEGEGEGEGEDNEGSAAIDVGAPEGDDGSAKPHPSVVKGAGGVTAASTAPPAGSDRPRKGNVAYNKSSFFDNISSDTGRVTRADERHRNFDTFGEAGGVSGPTYQQQGYQQQGYYGGGGGGRGYGRGRGGYRRGGGRGSYGAYGGGSGGGFYQGQGQGQGPVRPPQGQE